MYDYACLFLRGPSQLSSVLYSVLGSRRHAVSVAVLVCSYDAVNYLPGVRSQPFLLVCVNARTHTQKRDLSIFSRSRLNAAFVVYFVGVKWKWIHHMRRSHVRSLSEPAARKLGVTGSLRVCDVNNDRISHWLRFYMRSSLLRNKPNGLQTQASIIYLLDHWRQTFQATVLGLQMLGQHIGKITRGHCSHSKYRRKDSCGVQ